MVSSPRGANHDRFVVWQSPFRSERGPADAFEPDSLTVSQQAPPAAARGGPGPPAAARGPGDQSGLTVRKQSEQ